MKRPTKRTKDKFTATEVGTLIEKLGSEFKIFGEDLITVKGDVKSLKEMVAKNSEDIVLLKIAVKENAKLIKENTKLIRQLEMAVTDMATDIKALTKSIDKLVKTKADREDLQTLDKRVSILETKFETLSR